LGKKYDKREQEKEENVKEKQKINGKLKLNPDKNVKLTKYGIKRCVRSIFWCIAGGEK
jgi:hypothetical protein